MIVYRLRTEMLEDEHTLIVHTVSRQSSIDEYNVLPRIPTVVMTYGQ